MGRLLILLGKVWLYLAAALILLGYASILILEGWGALAEVRSPFNVWNVLAVVLALLPGFV